MLISNHLVRNSLEFHESIFKHGQLYESFSTIMLQANLHIKIKLPSQQNLNRVSSIIKYCPIDKVFKKSNALFLFILIVINLPENGYPL